MIVSVSVFKRTSRCFFAFAAFALFFQGCIGSPRPATTAYVIGETIESVAPPDGIDVARGRRAKRSPAAEDTASADSAASNAAAKNADTVDAAAGTAENNAAATGAASSAAANIAFNEVKNIVWQLTSVTFSYGTINLDRSALTKNVYSDFFTIQFRDEGVTGTAAPNNYFAPYALLGENNSIALRMIVSTQKALIGTINILNGLTEADYYRYTQNIYKWDSSAGLLTLYSKTDEQGEVVLTYIAGPRQDTP
jgi:heat shock protein HslJ